MNRHRQKDLEAGGDGCGTLDTRKRAWKAPDGAVVEKRPHPSDRAQASPKPSEGRANNRAALTSVTRRQQSRPAHTQVEPPSSPISEVESEQGRFLAEQHGNSIEASLEESVRPSNTHTSFFTFGQPGIAASSNQSWIDTALASLPPIGLANAWQLSYEQPFQPDTASSFNMPYTTAVDYNWLFNMNVQAASLSDASEQSTFSHDFDQVPAGRTMSHSQAQFALTPESHSSAPQWPDASNQEPIEDLRNTEYSHPNSRSRARPASGAYESGTALRDEVSYAARKGSTNRSANLSHRGSPLVSRHNISGLELERPLSLLLRPNRLPKLDEATRDQLLDVIEASKPCFPDQRHSIQDQPLLSLASLQSYLDLYFTRFNTAYPVIHMATFDPSIVERQLLVSVLLLGATYSAKDAHQLAVCIHDVIRPSIFAHAGFSARPELWMLQTILLVECFGKSRAGQKQHDMSHLFHGLLINLIRRSDCQSVRPEPPNQENDCSAGTLENAWRRWAEAEQKKRYVGVFAVG